MHKKTIEKKSKSLMLDAELEVYNRMDICLKIRQTVTYTNNINESFGRWGTGYLISVVKSHVTAAKRLLQKVMTSVDNAAPRKQEEKSVCNNKWQLRWFYVETKGSPANQTRFNEKQKTENSVLLYYWQLQTKRHLSFCNLICCQYASSLDSCRTSGQLQTNSLSLTLFLSAVCCIQKFSLITKRRNWTTVYI